MANVFDRVAALRGGGRALESARLRSNVMDLLHNALLASKMTQVELANRLQVRKSAVNRVFQGDGNVQINTLAEYLFEMGAELRVATVPFGTQRAEAVSQLEHHHRAAIEGMSRMTVEIALHSGSVNNLSGIRWQSGADLSRNAGQRLTEAA